MALYRSSTEYCLYGAVSGASGATISGIIGEEAGPSNQLKNLTNLIMKTSSLCV